MQSTMESAVVFGGTFLVLALYCGIDPFKVSLISEFPDFESAMVELPPWDLVPKEKDSENLLQKSEIRFKHQVQGPETIAFDPQGRGPYTGVADGRILFWKDKFWTDFAYTSPNRSALCDPRPSPMSYLEIEHICGRPLGLRFDKKTGELYIADPYYGLLKVGPEGGVATSLTTEAEGVPLYYTNDLDVDDEGIVYFTDSSTKYQRRNFMQLIFSAEPSGRVLKYNPSTKATTVLIRNLQFPNGLSLSEDYSFFVFCEGSTGRLNKYWLKGEKAGTWEVMANLPGYPDKVRRNEKGEYWVAIHYRRQFYNSFSAGHPKIRNFLVKLPIPTKIQYLLHIGCLHAQVVKYGAGGKLLHILEDREGIVVKAVSQVEEKDGKLWMGSFLMPFVAVYNLDERS